MVFKHLLCEDQYIAHLMCPDIPPQAIAGHGQLEDEEHPDVRNVLRRRL